MFEYGLLVQVLGGVPYLSRLERLIAIEAHLKREADALLRLGALTLGAVEDAARLSGRLRLSKADGTRLGHASRFRGLSADVNDTGVMAGLHEAGRSGYRDSALITWAASGAKASDAKWNDLLTRIEELPVPVFPLQGADIMGMGLLQGPAVGEILHKIESRWIAGGFALKRTELLEMAQALVGSLGSGAIQDSERERI